jgi:hypothetical protein
MALAMLTFLFGLVVGANVGLITAALCWAGRDN